ncbi:MAG: class I SAM-dependent methyltransferase [Gaiellaceae bacterium]
MWDQRAEAYRKSEEHRQGWDLDVLVEWAQGARTALDVASGGGHVARRLREAGIEVVTCDPAEGMRADVVCRAEELPFPDAGFEVVACRLAAHHFEDVQAGVREMARVAGDLVLIVDNLWVNDAGEEANRQRDSSHVRNYSLDEWRSLFAEAGLTIEAERESESAVRLEPWLERTGCRGAEAERVRELLADRIDNGLYRLDRVALKGRKAA